MSKRIQPPWKAPDARETPTLRLYNSLTRQKEVFVPLNGKQVTWYSCGPTVYDASHMGHARSYISFDILRRVLTDYFGYNVFYVMNITDIDDKIIKRARQNYLYEQYLKQQKPLCALIKDIKLVMNVFSVSVKDTTDPDKKCMMEKMLTQMAIAVTNLENAISGNDELLISKAQENLLKEARDPIADWLDRGLGKSITEKEIFNTLSRFWEDEFHKDMKALNVLPPDVLTRVSEYVPEIVSYIERIIENGLGYEANGSVYFDVNGFDKRDKHHYAKLVPEAFGDTCAINDAEGDLSCTTDRLSEKRSPNDFALWKCSRPGEPSWESPWGPGRPGWHIECSAMASDVLGDQIDIHTGGVDLKFPHHDNELAQTEAYYDKPEWVKYFLHTGHLTISGCKMSKSLKNFITIQDALARHSSTQLRLAFLMHSWKDTLDYSDNTMDMAVQFEKLLNEFFLTVKDLTRHLVTCTPRECFDSWTANESELQKKFSTSQKSVHKALCDNIDTRSALDAIRDLICSTNVYIRDFHRSKFNALLLRRIALYVSDILHIFGAISGPRGNIGFPVISNNGAGDMEQTLMPYLSALADFRDLVRDQARQLKATDVLQACDALRDDILPNLGVRLEDREGAPSAVKLVDRDTLLKEREAKRQIESEKQKERERKKAELQRATELKEAQRKVHPKDMFKDDLDKYSAFDDAGLPTHDKDGKEISKGLVKKLQKLQQAQEKRHNEYLAQ